MIRKIIAFKINERIFLNVWCEQNHSNFVLSLIQMSTTEDHWATSQWASYLINQIVPKSIFYLVTANTVPTNDQIYVYQPLSFPVLFQQYALSFFTCFWFFPLISVVFSELGQQFFEKSKLTRKSWELWSTKLWKPRVVCEPLWNLHLSIRSNLFLIFQIFKDFCQKFLVKSILLHETSYELRKLDI